MGKFQLNERVIPTDARWRENYGPGYVSAIDVTSTQREYWEKLTVKHDSGWTCYFYPDQLEHEWTPLGTVQSAAFGDIKFSGGTLYTTKDSGDRAEYASGMVRDTEAGKPRFDLLVPKGVPFDEQILTRFAALMARGAEKYDARNWEKAEGSEELARYHSSALRHLMQWITGETDEDHAAAVMFNIMAAETVKYKMNKPDPEPKAPVISMSAWKAAVSNASRGSDCEHCSSRP